MQYWLKQACIVICAHYSNQATDLRTICNEKHEDDANKDIITEQLLNRKLLNILVVTL